MSIKIAIYADNDRTDEEVHYGEAPNFTELCHALAVVKKIENEILDHLSNIEPEYEVNE